MKFIVIGRQTFDSYPDGTFDYKEFAIEEEAKEYVKNNRHREGNVKGRYKVYRKYTMQKVEGIEQ